MSYKNPDPGAENDGIRIALYTIAWYKKETARMIKSKYYNKSWTPLSMELQQVALDEIIRLFSDERVELQQIRRDNEWRYKPQDEIYPDLQKDLRKYFPS